MLIMAEDYYTFALYQAYMHIRFFPVKYSLNLALLITASFLVSSHNGEGRNDKVPTTSASPTTIIIGEVA